MISIIFKSLCKEVIAIFILKVAAKEFNNRELKVKAIKSLIKQNTTLKAGAFITSLKLIPLMILAALTIMMTANQIANLIRKFKKINLTLM